MYVARQIINLTIKNATLGNRRKYKFQTRQNFQTQNDYCLKRPVLNED